MRDAPTYPLVFINYGYFVLEFSHPKQGGTKVRTHVVIREKLVSEG